MNEMDKVKVSREEANAFENLKQVIAKRKGSNETSQLVLGFAEMAAGYEVEQTTQDKIKELFEKNLDMYDQAKENGLDGDAMFRDGRSDGILRTLEILNIKVPGVNE